MCLTYLLFLLVYFREYEMKNKAEQYNELIQMQLNSFQTEMTNTRKSEKKMSICGMIRGIICRCCEH